MLTRRGFLFAVAALPACQLIENSPAPTTGRQAPDFAADLLPMGTTSMRSLAGKPVVLNFFATWCVPCTKELPTFQQLAERYADKGLSFLLIDMQEDPDDVAVYLDNLKISLPAAIDRSGEVVKTYRVRALPSTFFIGRDQIIKMAQLGALDETLVNEGISKIV